MPEGHVIHADARRFMAEFGGGPVCASSPQGRFAAGAALLDGRVLREAAAYGKHLFLRFEPDRFLHVHLGLIGGWTWSPVPAAPVVAGAGGGVRLRLAGAAGRGVAAELRAAMVCSVVDEHAVDTVVATLGPDPILDTADPARAWARIRRSRTAIGTLLLDQSVVAGAGLIWRCEAPFLAAISPHRPGRDLAEPEWQAIWRHLRRIMRAAADLGTGSDGHTPPGVAFHVFRRGGEPCPRCGTTIETAKLGGRPVWWCPRHQPR